MTTRKWDAWNYRESTGISGRQDNLTGFKVHAVDGDIGKIDAATRDVGAGYVVVDTGPWIFGRKVMLPAVTVERLDWDDIQLRETVGGISRMGNAGSAKSQLQPIR